MRQIASGSLILVNEAHAYDAAPPGLTALSPDAGDVLLEHRAAALLRHLISDIHGWDQIVPVSGWRSYTEQQEIWDRSQRENGAAFTKQFVAAPGHSEHQTGLAIDLGLQQPHIDFIRPSFPYTGICQTFREHAARYGFIQRYPSSKEHITGIAHEPWHFRYVGVPHAEIMQTLSLTLEEYLTLLRQYAAAKEPFFFHRGAFLFQIAYLPAGEAKPAYPCIVSGDNAGGQIITTWKMEATHGSKTSNH